jgi:hypothetical protein
LEALALDAKYPVEAPKNIESVVLNPPPVEGSVEYKVEPLVAIEPPPVPPFKA